MELAIKEKTVPEIICALLADAGVMEFMPEVWREECGAVFLTGDIKREAFSESVGFEVAVRCRGTAGERNAAIKCLSGIEAFFGTCDVKSGGVRGYIVPAGGIKQVRTDKNGMAEYRAAYYLVREYTGESAHRYYINTGSKESPVWSLVGEGFYLFDEKTSCEIFSRRYFHENMTCADISEFSTEISFEVRLDSDAESAVKLCEIYEGLAEGQDNTVEILSLSRGEEKDYPGAFRAHLREYELLPTEYLRTRGCLTAAGKLLSRGGGRGGRFVMSTGIFTVKE